MSKTLDQRRATTNSALSPAQQLSALVRSQLEHAVDGVRRGHKVYESLKNLNEVIGTQYSDRVLYELIQNAHDAHSKSEHGKISINLTVRSPEDGVLYIANGGAGFRFENVEAIRNLAVSSKEVGEGIGNKGLGFRSTEALTDDVRIYSKRDDVRSNSFDGYCFRFANQIEIEDLLDDIPSSAAVKGEVAETIPRYLISVPLGDQPAEIAAFAQAGYATVVVLPLRTANAVELASAQVRELSNLEVPLLLFLDRIAEVRLEVALPNEEPIRRILRRRDELIGSADNDAATTLHRIDVGEEHKFLVVRRQVEKSQVIDAIKHSIPMAPQLRRWLDWKGDSIVSVAVSLDGEGVVAGRLYNFLPMGDAAAAPMAGYLDAPFFTDIDRRQAKLDLPLNTLFLKVAAEACVSAALYIIENEVPVGQQAVFDLIAWGSPHTGRIDLALKDHSTSLRDARIIPAISPDDQNAWTSLAEAILWPTGNYKVLEAREVARLAGSILVLPQLGERRIGRVKNLAGPIYRSLAPSADKLGQLVESFAFELAHRRAPPRAWSDFYEEAFQICNATGVKLKCLADKQIFIDQTGKLRPATTEASQTQRQVYVRDEAQGRTKLEIPYPPQSLARRYYFLSEQVRFSEEALRVFLKANLLRKFDPIEALAGIQSALGRQPSEERRREALVWAFELWKSAGELAEATLQEIDLYVPIHAGWTSASSAAFSASWTAIGSSLESYLVEASQFSVDCREASQALLISWQNWPKHRADAKRDWVRFLKIIGVSDGLRPVSAGIDRKGSPSYTWNALLHRGNVHQGFDDDWCEDVGSTSFNFPNTLYEMRDNAWRVPGQIEYEALPDSARRLLSNLIFEHLKSHGDNHFKFSVGRFDRNQRDWDQKFFSTPLATFLRSKPWLLANSKDDTAFCRPSSCWSARVRRGGVPRFMNRLSEERISEIIESEELSALVFSEAIGVRDWLDETTAPERLVDLAAIALDIAASDRAAFRREYRRAWFEVSQNKSELPYLSVVVSRRGQLEILDGDPKSPPEVIVTNDLSSFEAKALSGAGRPVLDVGDASSTVVMQLLKDTWVFAPLSLDGVRVQLIVDNSVFTPKATDPLLVDSGLEWLPELAAIGHAMLAEQLEKGISRSTIETRIRAIRLKRCDNLSLLIDGKELSSQDRTPFYAFEHEEIPTLILANDIILDWRALGRVASAISRLIDSRVRSLKTIISDLIIQRLKRELDAPTIEDLATVLSCDVDIVHEQILEFRADTGRILKMLSPVVAYFGDVETAHRLRTQADLLGPRFDIEAWLLANLKEVDRTPGEILDACKRAADFGELRRLLGMDYAQFNRVLSAVGELPVSNEEELRLSYQAYIQELKPDIIDRLRRHHLSDYASDGKLDQYVTRKTLSFLVFNDDWVGNCETLEREPAASHVTRLINDELGEDPDVRLHPLGALVDANRKTAMRAVREASPLVAVWCKKNNVQIPPLWATGDTQAVVRHVENMGFFDFDFVKLNDIAAFCWRADCWPSGMKQTIDKDALGFEERDLQEESYRRESTQNRIALERRTIVFAGTALDTGSEDFGDKFMNIAGSAIETDATWFERSSARVKLENFADSELTSGKSGAAGGVQHTRERQLTDAQRQGMGLAGEWLAFQYLRKLHGAYVDEESWVSENRRLFFGGSLGDDSAGYDFRVSTPQTEWLYEVKATLEGGCEFEITANELRVASGAAKDGRRKYRILYVRHVFSPNKWFVMELPNPMGERSRNKFQVFGRGALRLRFESL